MAQPNASNLQEFSETVLCDEDGSPVLIIGAQKVTVFGPNGEISEYASDSSIRLADGLIWSPQMLRWNNPVALTSCSVCRNPPASFFCRQHPAHGLFSIRNARMCIDCGRVTCPQHRRLTNGGWRCLSCAKRQTLWRLITPIFFREER